MEIFARAAERAAQRVEKKTQTRDGGIPGDRLRAYQYYESAEHYPDVPGLDCLGGLLRACLRTICWDAATSGAKVIRAAGRRPRGLCSRRGACPARMHPPFSFRSCRKENGPCTVQKKRALGALRCSGPPRATGVGVSVQAPIWAGLRARYALLRGRYCRPVADGAEVVGVVIALSCSSFRCRWPVVDGSLQHGPMQQLLRPPGQRVAKRNARKEERGQMRPCTPIPRCTAPRESTTKSAPRPAAPVVQSSQTRRHPLTPPPVQQLCTHVQSCARSDFFFSTGRGAFSF